MPTTKSGQIVKASDTVNTVEGMLTKYESQIAMALPSVVSVKRLIRVALTTMKKTPALGKCSAASLCGAVVQAAQLGLDVDSNLGHAYLVPYGNECTLIVGYRGMLDLVRRSGEASSAEARAVYEGDLFEYAFGLNPTLNHKPSGNTSAADLTHVYALIRLRDGGVLYDVMTREDVDAIRGRSRAGRAGPWVTDFAEMAKKTVLRRLCKTAPMSVTAQRAVTLDEAADANLSQKLDVEWQAVTEQEPIEATAVEVEPPADDTPETDAATRAQMGEWAVQMVGNDKQAIGDLFEQTFEKRSIKTMKGEALGEAHGKMRDAFTKWSKE
jgi:recombination protein RecT